MNGTGFVTGATVNWNGEPLSTSFVNSGRLAATVPAANASEPGTASVTAVNPGATVASNVVFFTVTPATQSVAFASAGGSPIPVGVAPVWLSAADFNGDGKLDLAVVNETSNTVSILQGNGDGTFTPAPGHPVPVDASLTGLATHDFNGDGKLDLAVVGLDGNQIAILLGNGDGNRRAKLSQAAIAKRLGTSTSVVRKVLQRTALAGVAISSGEGDISRHLPSCRP